MERKYRLVVCTSLFTSAAESTRQFAAKKSAADNGDRLHLTRNRIESTVIVDVAEERHVLAQFSVTIVESRQCFRTTT